MDISTWGAASGLALVHHLSESVQRTPRAPYDQLGMRISTVEKGRVALAWTPPEAILNRARVVHGGFVATALDEVCGLAAISLTEPSIPYLSMNLNVDYLRPVRAGETYTVVGTVQQSGRIRTLALGSVSDSTGRPCAHATVSLTPNHALLQAAAAARSAAPGIDPEAKTTGAP